MGISQSERERDDLKFKLRQLEKETDKLLEDNKQLA
jgi:hypothetical protein